jgi:CRP-like cAMP-binding protein
MIHPLPGKVSISDIRQLSLFSSLKDDELQSVAAHADKVAFEARDRIITEGDAGDYFYVILSGQVQVLREDEDGEQKVLNYLSAGAFFGEESLLTRRPRNASVEGVKAGELLRFSAQSFQIFQTDAQFSRVLARIHEVNYTRSTISTVSFSGQTPGELCLAVERRHTYALAESIIAPVLTALVTSIGLAFLAQQGYFGTGSVLLISALLAAALTLWMLWLIADWWNDQYIVTPKRVIEIEKVLLFNERRLEAPIEQVQSVNITTPFLLGNLFGYQDLVITTGSSSGPLKFTAVANAERLKQKILDARMAALSQGSSVERQQIEEELRRKLEHGAGPPAQPAEGVIIDELPRPAYRAGVLGAVWHGIDYLVPRVEEHRLTAIVWRRHPFVLIRQTVLPLLAVFLLVPLSVLAFFDEAPLNWFLQFRTGPLWLLLSDLAVLVWLLWAYEDWHNDYYAVTDTQIIDRNSLPLGINEDKRTGPFDAIQDVNVELSGFFNVLFNMGDVLVSTSGQGEAFRFNRMYRPRDVQQEIMRRLNSYRDRLRQRQAQQRRSEMADWFAAYQGLTDDPDRGDLPA